MSLFMVKYVGYDILELEMYGPTVGSRSNSWRKPHRIQG